MKRLKTWHKALIGLLLGLSGLVGLSVAWLRHLETVHQHCIKQVWFSLDRYAAANAGLFPFHTNGFGDALAVWAKFDSLVTSSLVGVDDDAAWLAAATTNGVNVDENICTRIYVQGLSLTNNPDIAVLFDRYAVKGGDHGRGSGPYLREVAPIGGGMLTVTLAEWPAFASNQVELLVEAGILRETAEAYYRPTLEPDAKR